MCYFWLYINVTQFFCNNLLISNVQKFPVSLKVSKILPKRLRWRWSTSSPKKPRRRCCSTPSRIRNSLHSPSKAPLTMIVLTNNAPTTHQHRRNHQFAPPRALARHRWRWSSHSPTEKGTVDDVYLSPFPHRTRHRWRCLLFIPIFPLISYNLAWAHVRKKLSNLQIKILYLVCFCSRVQQMQFVRIVAVSSLLSVGNELVSGFRW